MVAIVAKKLTQPAVLCGLCPAISTTVIHTCTCINDNNIILNIVIFHVYMNGTRWVLFISLAM